jgi:hypothetical protein
MTDAIPQPPSPAVAVRQEGDTLVIEMLPSGFNGQNRRSVAIFSTFIVLGLIGAAIAATANLLPGPTIGIACFFAALGIAGLIKVCLRASRNAVVRITDDAMTIVWRDVWSDEEDTWTRDELTEVQAHRTDFNMDGGATRELEIVRKNDHTVRLLHGRSREELFWLADLIRQRYGLKARLDRPM